MSIGILGKKIGMTRVYDEAGSAVPVTVIQAEPNVVSQIKTVEKDGYAAAQLAIGKKSKRQARKPQVGHLKKANSEAKAFMREFRMNGEELKPGDLVNVTQFQTGQLVDVIGLSKGRGFQGVVKRHRFHGQPDSHGSKMHRRPGSIGQCATPSRTYKNTEMPGRMGNSRVTVQNLKVVQVREEDHVLLVRGAVPGSRGSYVMVRNAVKAKKGKK